jgi:carboxymethylenebutenolidase
MCFDSSARPPPPPITGYLAESNRLTLTADDGNRVVARMSVPNTRDTPGVVILPDVRGLHKYYELLADDFAQTGVCAIAIDFYGRTAGAEYRDDTFDYGPHRAAATDENVRADVRAAIAELEAGGRKNIYVLGFCFGGRAAFMQASQPGVAGVVGFYGWPTRMQDGASPVVEAKSGLVRARVLALYGGADEGITPDDAAAYKKALESAGVESETVVYPGAPHSFFDRRMEEHADACADAWRRALRFMGLSPPDDRG